MSGRDYGTALAIDGEIRGYALPCSCGHATARVYPAGAHLRADCEACGRYLQFVSRADLGLDSRPVRTRPDISPSTRARIFARDNYRCVACGRAVIGGAELHVGHMLSVADANALRADGVPVTDDDVNGDENLFASCAECNLGQGARSYFPRAALMLIRAARSRTP
jgi:hypothetical protein